MIGFKQVAAVVFLWFVAAMILTGIFAVMSPASAQSVAVDAGVEAFAGDTRLVAELYADGPQVAGFTPFAIASWGFQSVLPNLTVAAGYTFVDLWILGSVTAGAGLNVKRETGTHPTIMAVHFLPLPKDLGLFSQVNAEPTTGKWGFTIGVSKTLYYREAQ
jgi:hypothetical protein